MFLYIGIVWGLIREQLFLCQEFKKRLDKKWTKFRDFLILWFIR